jgi:hypothetical protein
MIRLFLLVEAAAFITAASIHFGVWTSGYEHEKAGIAESVIALVLLAGLAWTWIRPRSVRAASLAAQAFALLGTIVEIVTIVIGVGPRTIPDIVYHNVIVIVVAIGLLVARHE